MYTWVIFFLEYRHQSVTFNWQVVTRGGGRLWPPQISYVTFLIFYILFNQYTHTIVELDEHNFKKEMIKVLPQRCIFTTFSLQNLFSFAFMVKQTIEESAPTSGLDGRHTPLLNVDVWPPPRAKTMA